jgi:hypothetical protein
MEPHGCNIRRKTGLNTVEKFHIYLISKGNLHVNDSYIGNHKAILETPPKLHDR